MANMQRLPQTWEEIFAGVPTAPGTEAEQRRHEALRARGAQMTEEEEEELNALFSTIYPQFSGAQRCLEGQQES